MGDKVRRGGEKVKCGGIGKATFDGGRSAVLG
jgi:hypothetical protein